MFDKIMKINPETLYLGQVLELRDKNDLKFLLKNNLITKDQYEFGVNNQDIRFVVNDNVITNACVGEKILFYYMDNYVNYYMLQCSNACIETPLIHKEKDKEIINEMIDKVDFKTIKKLISICASNNRETIIVDDKVVRRYLELWANAKYDFYMMFDRNLTIDKNVQLNMDIMNASQSIDELKIKYLKYYPLISMFSVKEISENNLIHVSSDLNTMIPNVKPGTKITKLMHKITNDIDFVNDLSAIVQQKTCNAILSISIDPYDYLTSSINKNNWRSCHNIVDGDYATGCLSYMIDEATIVSYRSNKKTFNYSYYNIDFKGNSKTFRQLIYLDKYTSTFVMSKPYPYKSSQTSKAICDIMRSVMLQKTDYTYKNISVYGMYLDIKEVSDLQYCDIGCNDTKFDMCLPNELLYYHNQFLIGGSDVFCVECGEKIIECSDNLLCEECNDEQEENDEDYEFLY